MEKFDIIVIGGGPAGVSSAIYATRAGSSVCVFDDNRSKLKEAKDIANFYGFEKISGEKLFQKGKKQLKELGIREEEISIDFIEKDFERNVFILKASGKDFEAKAVILATGLKSEAVDKRLEKFAKKNISKCAVCDGFFYKGKDVAVLGSQNYALEEAKILSQVCKNVYILADKKCNFESKDNIIVIRENIVEFVGNDNLEKIVFENNKQIQIDGLFIATGQMGASDIATKLGVVQKNGRIVVNQNCETNIAGLYAVGDITEGLCQVSKAVYQGTIAGLESSKYVKTLA